MCVYVYGVFVADVFCFGLSFFCVFLFVLLLWWGFFSLLPMLLNSIQTNTKPEVPQQKLFETIISQPIEALHTGRAM